MSSIPSPCIGICTIDEATGFCKGCHRMLAEVAAWPRLPDAEKQKIWDNLATRKLNN